MALALRRLWADRFPLVQQVHLFTSLIPVEGYGRFFFPAILIAKRYNDAGQFFINGGVTSFLLLTPKTDV